MSNLKCKQQKLDDLIFPYQNTTIHDLTFPDMKKEIKIKDFTMHDLGY